jgi:hypothetical protein
MELKALALRSRPASFFSSSRFSWAGWSHVGWMQALAVSNLRGLFIAHEQASGVSTSQLYREIQRGWFCRDFVRHQWIHRGGDVHRDERMR